MNSRLKALAGVVVIHLGTGMAPMLVAKFLAELGANVIRVAPPGGDPFVGFYPAYALWLRDCVVDAEAQQSNEHLQRLLSKADICLMGGEDYPGLVRPWRAADLSARHPRLVVLDITAAPEGTEFADQPAAEILLQARSGLAFEQYYERPIFMAFSPANQGAAMRGLVGILAALFERESSGLGQVVSTSLLEGAYAWVCGKWNSVEKPTPYTQFTVPKSPTPLIFRCADGAFVHFVLGGAGSKYGIYQALEIDDPSVKPEDSGMPKPTADTRNFYGDVDLLAAHASRLDSEVLLQRIWSRGLPAERVWPVGRCWDEPQVRHNDIIRCDSGGIRYVGNPLQMTALLAKHQVPVQAADRPPDKLRDLVPVQTGKRPLEGVRVVDFGAFVAGPFASAVLADLGADVVKVESLAGDPHRGVYRFYTSVNRGKRAISLDMKKPDGGRVSRQLCAGADIVLSNFRPGVSLRLGIDVESLQALRPGVVVLESPAYGNHGPLAERSGFDMVMQAYCGHEHRAGGVGNLPMWNRTSMVDFMSGFLGATGILVGLYHRARSGEGSSIVCPLVNAGIALLPELLQHANGDFEGDAPLNAAQTGFHPAEAFYQAHDAWLAIAVRGSAAALALEQVLNLEGQLGAQPLDWGNSAAQAIAGAVAIRDIADLLPALENAGVWAEPCRKDIEKQVLNDPLLQASNTVQVSNHPTFGKVRELGAMLRFSRSRAGHQRHAPLPGESSAEILAELGFDATHIQTLMQARVVA